MKPNYKNRKYEVLPYDHTWAEQFAEESKVLKSIFADEAISIEHVGSTAIQGLAGKPTIDVLVIVDDISTADRLKEKMEFSGYQSLGEYVMQGARLFVKESDNNRTRNIHVFQRNHPHVQEMLQLRDYLRTHPDVANEYNNLKFDLAKKYPDDYEQYRRFKDRWMNALKEKIAP